MNAFKELAKTFEKLFKTRKDMELPAFLGNLSGTVKADDANHVYVTIIPSGEVRTVYNGKVPNVPRLPVIIGYSNKSNQFEILRTRDVYVTPAYPEVPPHALLHTFPGVDTIPIRGEQFLPGLVTPASGVNIKLYGFNYQLADGWHVVPTQTVDLSAHVPATGALYVLLQVDDTGAVTLTDGTGVDTREALGYDDIPASDAEQLVVAAIKLYAGQTSLLFTLNDTDIVDLRWGRDSGGSTASGITVTDAGNYFAGATVEDILQELGLDGRSFASTVTAMGTTTLNATSPTVQMFTGTSLQNVELPDTSTIFTSKKFHIINRSTQVVTVRTSTGVLLLILGPETDNVFTCTSTANNLATSWKWTTTSEDALVFTDIGTADSSTTKHGLLRKLSGSATEFMNGLGNWVNATTAVLTGFTAGSGTVLATDTILQALQKIVGNYVGLSGNETITGVKTFSSDPLIPDEAYDATAWNGNLEPPTKNAVRDKIETMAVRPSFSVHKNGTDQTGVVSGTPTKLTWSTEVYDTNSNFASDKFTPTVAGKYLFIVSIRMVEALGGATYLNANLYKNGSSVARSAIPIITTTHIYPHTFGTFLVDANGSSDYFEVYIHHDKGSNMTVYGLALDTYFQGYLAVP